MLLAHNLGMYANGGDFDASKSGAGAEANRFVAKHTNTTDKSKDHLKSESTAKEVHKEHKGLFHMHHHEEQGSN